MWMLATAFFTFLGVQLSLAFALDQRKIVLHDRIYENKAKLLREHWKQAQPDRERILVMGSSRLLFGLDAGSVDANVFNFGIAAAGPMTQNLYLKRLIADGLRPDVVVIEILPAFFNDAKDRTPMESKWLVPSRYRPDEREDSATDKLIRRIAPVYEHRISILSQSATGFLTREQHIDGNAITDANGFARTSFRSVTPEQRRKGVEGARQQYEPELRNFQWGNPGAQALKEMLKLCSDKGIRVLLLRMPEGTEFRAFYPARALHIIDDELAKLNVPIIDARQWVADEGFHDGHHLLIDGAKTFTQQFARELLPLLK